MAWDTFSRRRIDLIGRKDDGDQVIAHEFDFSVPNQLIYSRNGVEIISTPVSHYETEGPVALRLNWNGLSVTYSGNHMHYHMHHHMHCPHALAQTMAHAVAHAMAHIMAHAVAHQWHM